MIVEQAPRSKRLQDGRTANLPSENGTKLTHTHEGVCPFCGGMTFKGIPVQNVLSFPLMMAAKMLGMSYRTLRRKIIRGEIQMNKARRISKVEMERYATTQWTRPRANAKKELSGVA